MSIAGWSNFGSELFEPTVTSESLPFDASMIP
jgi:hypothetical protein